jgi:aminoglycoside 6-adenylyltransferase
MAEPSVSEHDEAFLNTIVEWASGRPDVVALIMTGSRARPDGIVDAFSDYDLEIFTTDPSVYTSSDEWMREIEDVWVYLPTTSSRGRETRLVVFQGGKKVDFSIWPAGALERTVELQKLDDLYERGFRVLADKTGVASHLPSPSYAPPVRHAPAETEFRAAVEEFWFEASHIPKYLKRDDLWVVKHRDWTMKQLLLRMAEWHAIASHGAGYDTWHLGIRMKHWVPPEVWQRLQGVFGRFDAADSGRALLETISLFRDLATETAVLLQYQYPQAADEAISGYIREVEDTG